MQQIRPDVALHKKSILFVKFLKNYYKISLTKGDGNVPWLPNTCKWKSVRPKKRFMNAEKSDLKVVKLKKRESNRPRKIEKNDLLWRPRKGREERRTAKHC